MNKRLFVRPKKVIIEKSNRLYQLAPTIDSLLPHDHRRSLLRKTSVLDLASFRWPTAPDEEHLPDASLLGPATVTSLNKLRDEIAGWFQTHHGVRLDPQKELYIGGGISDLMFNIALAFVDHGTLAFVPELGIPLYRRVTTACGGEAVSYAVSPRNNWQPDFERVGTRLGRVAGILFLNTPHNPTGAELDEKQMADLIWLAGRENVLVVNDAAYASISGRRHVSLLSVSGGKQVGVEVYSFAYNVGLPAMPFGFVAGNREVIEGVKQAAQLTRHPVSEYQVKLAVQAIRQFPNESLKEVRSLIYANEAETARILRPLQFEKAGSDTVPYVWARIERRRQSIAAATTLYRRGRILVVPGTALGDSGEGFLRFSLTAPADHYSEAVQRVKKLYKRTQLGGTE
ncbi:MAG: aminotransferase class I/II-fold pyridoxal phosphate-dependent enzyme [Candidatus Zixiibacteriota bacterium]